MEYPVLIQQRLIQLAFSNRSSTEADGSNGEIICTSHNELCVQMADSTFLAWLLISFFCYLIKEI